MNHNNTQTIFLSGSGQPINHTNTQTTNTQTIYQEDRGNKPKYTQTHRPQTPYQTPIRMRFSQFIGSKYHQYRQYREHRETIRHEIKPYDTPNTKKRQISNERYREAL